MVGVSIADIRGGGKCFLMNFTSGGGVSIGHLFGGLFHYFYGWWGFDESGVVFPF